MPKSIPFVKMQGLGNDFVVIDDETRLSAELLPLTSEIARKICDRRFGVGADQILWLRAPKNKDQADVRMEILNADGSTAEMCGNGIRAVALYLQDRHSKKRQDSYRVETLAGVLEVVIQKSGEVAVDMGVPSFGAAGEEIEALGRKFGFIEVNVGNPHAVIFVDDVLQVPLESWGPALESHPRFPKRTNVEFVQILSPREIRVRVWERGAGVTLACGTGACASAVAALFVKSLESPLRVHLPGGALSIHWAGPGKRIQMVGPAKEVFRGEYHWDQA